MIKLIPSILAVALMLIGFSATARAQDSSAADDKAMSEALKKLPGKARKAEDFVPPGWEIYSQAEGDLNGDGLTDYALDIWPKEAQEGWYYDAVIVLFAERGGGLRRFAMNEALTGNGFGAKPRLTVEKGVLVANTNYGNGEATDVTFRFRYDPAAGKLMLIGFRIENYSRPGLHDAHITSENYLTGVRIETVMRMDTVDKPGRTTSKRSRFKPKKVAFEEAGLNYLESGEVRPY